MTRLPARIVYGETRLHEAQAALETLRQGLVLRERDRFAVTVVDALARQAAGDTGNGRIDAYRAALAARTAVESHVAAGLLRELMAFFERAGLTAQKGQAAALLAGYGVTARAQDAAHEPCAALAACGPFVLTRKRALTLGRGMALCHLCGLGARLGLLTRAAPQTLLLLDADAGIRRILPCRDETPSFFADAAGRIVLCAPQRVSLRRFSGDGAPLPSCDLGAKGPGGTSPEPLYGCACGELFCCIVRENGRIRLLLLAPTAQGLRAAFVAGWEHVCFSRVFAHAGLLYATGSDGFLSVFEPVPGTVPALRLRARVFLAQPPVSLAFAGEHVLCVAPDALSILDARLHLVGTLPLAPAPWQIAVSTDGAGRRTLWCGAAAADTLYAYALERADAGSPD